jgi:chemotaxis protein methyltransferase CheR
VAFTYFFRDLHTLRLIEEHVIPALRTRRYMDVWDAGCAMGPEPYSIAILFRENVGGFQYRNLRLLATDIDESGHFGEIITQGVYPDEQLERIPADIRGRYFEDGPDPKTQRVVEEVRSRVTFQWHDLLSLEPPGSGFGLVVCKNVLLHFREEQRHAVISMFHDALADGGFLAMEQTQKLPEILASRFEQVSADAQLYRKVAGS